ncbi:MAG: hypothetical protein JKY32_04290 [Rhizobiales bacterium]|nr:hypothetical protein [Hyphomicrobiales bacterium]
MQKLQNPATKSVGTIGLAGAVMFSLMLSLAPTNVAANESGGGVGYGTPGSGVPSAPSASVQLSESVFETLRKDRETRQTKGVTGSLIDFVENALIGFILTGSIQPMLKEELDNLEDSE